MGLYADEESRNHGHAMCLGMQLEKGYPGYLMCVMGNCLLPRGVITSRISFYRWPVFFNTVFWWSLGSTYSKRWAHAWFPQAKSRCHQGYIGGCGGWVWMCIRIPTKAWLMGRSCCWWKSNKRRGLRTGRACRPDLKCSSGWHDRKLAAGTVWRGVLEANTSLGGRNIGLCRDVRTEW